MYMLSMLFFIIQCSNFCSSFFAQHTLCNICCKQNVAYNTVYTGVNGACNMLHEIELFPISCNMLQAPLTPV